MKTKISENDLRDLIKNEVRKIVGEDALIDPPELGEPYYTDYVDDEYEEEGGWGDVEDEWSPHHDPHVVSIGKPMGSSPCASGKHSLSEGCGCGGSKKMDDHPVDKMVSDILVSPRPCAGCGKIHTGGCGGNSTHHKGSYMALPQLTKIANYANKLLSMIDEGEQIQDWQESKISQMSQMIGDVYHSIEYKKHKGEI
mgnify:CR=1 FL=1